MSETRSKKMDFVDGPQGTYKVSWEVEGHKMEIGVTSTHIKEAVTKMAGIPGLTQKMAMILAEKGYCSVTTEEPGRGEAGEHRRARQGRCEAHLDHLVRKDEGEKVRHLRGSLDAEGKCPECTSKPANGTSKDRLNPYLLRGAQDEQAQGGDAVRRRL